MQVNQVFQIRLKVYLLADIPACRIQEKLAAFIDSGFLEDGSLRQMHEENRYKGYCFDALYPIEQDGIYRSGKIYTVTVRTVVQELARYFYERCVNHYTAELKGLTAEIRILPKKRIETLYTITPVILKTPEGYWRRCMNLDGFEERLKINLIKKWNYFYDAKLDEGFELYTSLEFLNKTPIAVEYKNVRLLGDKIRLQIADNEAA